MFKKNGHIHNGKQNHQCKTCGRQFVVDATNRVIDAEHRSLVERLLCEKFPCTEFAACLVSVFAG
jgi:transposase-like protein